MSEWLLFNANSAIFSTAMSWREQVNCQWDDYEVRFVLDQHAKLDFYSASSLKRAGRHVTPLGHIILIPSQPVFVLSPKCCVLSGEATHINFIALVWPDRGSNTRFTALEASTPTITPPMRLIVKYKCYLNHGLKLKLQKKYIKQNPQNIFLIPCVSKAHKKVSYFKSQLIAKKQRK